MEVSLLSLTACASAFVGAACMSAAFVGIGRRSQASFVGGGFGARARRLLVAGVPGFVAAFRIARGVSFVARWADQARFLAVTKGARSATAEGVGSCLLACVVVLFVGATLVCGSALGGLASACCLVVAVAMASARAREHSDEAVREAVPDALRAMGTCFQAGLSLEQTLRQVSREMEGELSRLFGDSVRTLEMGGTIPEALERLRDGTSEALSFVSVALDMQHSSGGSMRNVLAAAGDSVSSELALRRSLKVQTAQAKLSAQVVSLMPFVLIAVFSFTTEDFLAPFFESTAGIALLLLACSMQVAGIAMVRRMLAVGGLR